MTITQKFLDIYRIRTCLLYTSLDGQDITELDINHRANAGIGFAFQQPPRFTGMTVMKLLKLAAKDELSDKAVSYTHLFLE